MGFLFLDLHPRVARLLLLLLLRVSSFSLSQTHCHTQLCHIHNFVTYNFVTHTQLCHIQLCHTHTQLCHTQLCHIQLCHIQPCHTHNFVTYNFVTTLSQHCHIQLCHTRGTLSHLPRCHTQSLGHTTVTYRRHFAWQAGVALGDICLRFAWQAWHLATSTLVSRGTHGTYGTGLALVAQLGHIRRGTFARGRHTWRHLPSFHVAGVALGDIHLRFAWQAWYLWDWAGSGGTLGRRDAAALLRGRRGTWRHLPSFHVAGVALGDIHLRFVWQAYWDWVGSGGALERR